jgi:hypothetical protein
VTCDDHVLLTIIMELSQLGVKGSRECFVVTLCEAGITPDHKLVFEACTSHGALVRLPSGERASVINMLNCFV